MTERDPEGNLVHEIRDKDGTLFVEFLPDILIHGVPIQTPCALTPQYTHLQGDVFWTTWKMNVMSTLQDMLHVVHEPDSRWLGYWLSPDQNFVYGTLYLQKTILQADEVAFSIVLETKPCSSFVPMAQVIYYRKSSVRDWFSDQERHVFFGSQADFGHIPGSSGEPRRLLWDHQPIQLGTFVTQEWLESKGFESYLGNERYHFLIGSATVRLFPGTFLESVTSVEDAYFSFQQLELIHQMDLVTDGLILSLRELATQFRFSTFPETYNSDWVYFKSWFEPRDLMDPFLAQSCWDNSVPLCMDLNDEWISPRHEFVFDQYTDHYLSSFLSETFARLQNHINPLLHLKGKSSNGFVDFVDYSVSPFTQFLKIPDNVESDLVQTMVYFKVKPYHKWAVSGMNEVSFVPPCSSLFPRSKITDRRSVYLAPSDMEHVEAVEEYLNYCTLEMRIWVQFRFPMTRPFVYQVVSKWNVREWNFVSTKVRSTMDVYRQIYSLVLYRLASVILSPDRLLYNLDPSAAFRQRRSAFDVQSFLVNPKTSQVFQQSATQSASLTSDIPSILLSLNHGLTSYVMREWVANALCTLSHLFGRIVYSFEDPEVIGWIQHELTLHPKKPFMGSVRVGKHLYSTWFKSLEIRSNFSFPDIHSESEKVFFAEHWLGMTFIPLYGRAIGAWEQGWIDVTASFKIPYPFQITIDGREWNHPRFTLAGIRFCTSGLQIQQMINKYVTYMKRCVSRQIEPRILFTEEELADDETVDLPWIRFTQFVRQLPVPRRFKRIRT